VTQPVPQSPDWWVARLYKQLQARRSSKTDDLSVDELNAYYRGRPTHLPWLPDQARDEFARLLKLTKSNYMGLVVDATAERMHIDGFRVGDNVEADKATWDIWQANRFSNQADQAILEALITGCSYLLVAPPAADGGQPLLYAEHPTQAVVEFEPGSARQRRAAGLKVWLDDWTGQTMATLYLPDAVYKYQAPKIVDGVTTNPRWEPREVRGERWPAPNPLGEVPLVPIENNPRLLTGGVSEIDDVWPIQDRICKTIADRLMTQDFGAFPQKWATGYPDEDADGNKQRIDIGRNRMVTSDTAETRFGQWEAAALDPYSAAKREDVKDIASRTRTPAQYLLGELTNVNGETLKAAESGLTSKVRQRMVPQGDGFEEAMRLARRAVGIGQAGEPIETIWRNPEFRTEGELVDALTKMATLGVPHEALWERWGASQVEIDRWRSLAAAQAERDPVGRMTRMLGQQGGGDDDDAGAAS
jgi:hypothetical protein